MLKHLDDPFNLMILKEGEIGYSCKKINCVFNEKIIDKVKRTENQ